MHAKANAAIKTYEIDSHLNLLFKTALINPMPTSNPSTGCALPACPNFKRRMLLRASSGEAVGSLYTFTIGWIKGREYTKSHAMAISPIVSAEISKHKLFLSVCRLVVFQENRIINGIQMTPAEKIALV